MLPVRCPHRPQIGDEPVADPMLYWVMRGSALITADDQQYRLAEESGLWVPRGTSVRVRLGTGDVVVPVIGISAGSCSHAVRLQIDPALRGWLLYAFATQLGHLDGTCGRDAVGHIRVVAEPCGKRAARPQYPSSEDLRTLADELGRRPERAVGEIVRQVMVGWSERTVQRRFVAETGLTPSRWLRSMQACRACEYLEQGRDIEWVAHACGYQSLSGFSRMFRQETGVSPARWVRGTDCPADTTPVLRADTARPLPRQRTWARVNSSHVAVWVVYGEARCTVGEQAMNLRAGDAVILPAGIHNTIATSEGSLILPVGYRIGSQGAVGRPVIPAKVRPEDSDELVRAAVAAYTPVAQPGTDIHAGFEFVRARAGQLPPTAHDEIMARLATAITMDEIAGPSLSACACWFGISERELSRIVNECTGRTFAQWLRTSRMSRARTQVYSGQQAGIVARRLGYANLPAFSRAFREVHGTSAQQIAGIDQQAEALRWQTALTSHILR